MRLPRLGRDPVPLVLGALIGLCAALAARDLYGQAYEPALAFELTGGLLALVFGFSYLL